VNPPETLEDQPLKKLENPATIANMSTIANIAPHEDATTSRHGSDADDKLPVPSFATEQTSPESGNFSTSDEDEDSLFDNTSQEEPIDDASTCSREENKPQDRDQANKENQKEEHDDEHKEEINCDDKVSSVSNTEALTVIKQEPEYLAIPGHSKTNGPTLSQHFSQHATLDGKPTTNYSVTSSSQRTENRELRGLAKELDEQDRIAKHKAKNIKMGACPPPRETLLDTSGHDALLDTNSGHQHRLSLEQEKRRATYMETGMKPGAYPDRGPIDANDADTDRYQWSRRLSSAAVARSDPDIVVERDVEEGRGYSNSDAMEPLVEAFVVTDEQSVISVAPSPKMITTAQTMISGDHVEKPQLLEEQRDLDSNVKLADLLLHRNMLLLIGGLVCCFVILAVVVVVVIMTTVVNTSSTTNASNQLEASPTSLPPMQVVYTTMAPSATLLSDITAPPSPFESTTPIDSTPTNAPEGDEDSENSTLEPITPVPTVVGTDPSPTLAPTTTTTATTTNITTAIPVVTASPSTPVPATTRPPTPIPTSKPTVATPVPTGTARPTEAPVEPLSAVAETPNPTEPPTPRPTWVETPDPTDQPTVDRAVVEEPTDAPETDSGTGDSSHTAKVYFDVAYTVNDNGQPSSAEQSLVDTTMLNFFTDSLKNRLQDSSEIRVKHAKIVSSQQSSTGRGWSQSLVVEYTFDTGLPPLELVLRAFSRNPNVSAIQSVGSYFANTNTVSFTFDIPRYGR
jgi:hypothetical protein